MLEILSDLKISNCETRHCSVVSVGCPLYSDTQLIDSWQLWRGRAGDALDSVRQDRHYARKVALVTSVMVVILPPIWKLLSLISFINLLFSLVISLKVRRERTQYPLKSTGWPVCNDLKQGSVNQVFWGVFLMFWACLDHKWWAKFHLGILGP